MTYGATVGMNYRLKAWKPFGKMRILEGNHFLDNTFIGIAAGGQFQASRLTSEMGLTNSIGPHISLSAGKWLIPAFGLRLSAFKSADTWHKKVIASSASSAGEEFYEMSAYAGGAWKVCWMPLIFLTAGNSVPNSPSMYWRAVNWDIFKKKMVIGPQKADIRDLQAACNLNTGFGAMFFICRATHQSGILFIKDQ